MPLTQVTSAGGPTEGDRILRSDCSNRCLWREVTELCVVKVTQAVVKRKTGQSYIVEVTQGCIAKKVGESCVTKVTELYCKGNSRYFKEEG